MQDKRNRILDATTAVIRDNGLQALSFETIAREAGVSRQLVRYYHPDLDHLIAELCDHLANGYRDAVIAGIVKVEQVDRLGFFLDFFFELAKGHTMPDNLAAYDSLVAYALGSDRVRDRLCDQYNTLGKVISHELEISYPDLDGRASDELSYLFVSMMHAHWSFVATLGYSSDHGRLMRRAIDRLIESYTREPTTTVEKPWLRVD